MYLLERIVATVNLLYFPNSINKTVYKVILERPRGKTNQNASIPTLALASHRARMVAACIVIM